MIMDNVNNDSKMEQMLNDSDNKINTVEDDNMDNDSENGAYC